MDKLSTFELKTIYHRRSPYSEVPTSRLELEERISSYGPIDLIEQHIGCFTMINFDIDRCLKDIKVPEDWKWSGYTKRTGSWIDLLVNEDSLKLNLICNIYDDAGARYNVTISVEKGDAKLLYPDIDIQDSIENCNKRYTIIPLRIIFDEVSAHSNVLFVDNLTRIVERFEPHGELSVTYIEDEKINNLLLQYVNDNLPGYKYVKPLDYCPRMGPQRSELEAKKHGYKRYGFCNAFSLLYIHLRLSYPNKDRSSIIDVMTKGGSLATYNRILKYAYLVSLVMPGISYEPMKYQTPSRLSMDTIANFIIRIIDPILKKVGIEEVYPESFTIALKQVDNVKDIVPNFRNSKGILYQDKLMEISVESQEYDEDGHIYTDTDIVIKFTDEERINRGIMSYIAGYYKAPVAAMLYDYSRLFPYK